MTNLIKVDGNNNKDIAKAIKESNSLVETIKKINANRQPSNQKQIADKSSAKMKPHN